MPKDGLKIGISSVKDQQLTEIDTDKIKVLVDENPKMTQMTKKMNK